MVGTRKHIYSIDFTSKKGKAIIRYRRYRYYHNMIFIIWFSVWLLASLLSVFSIRSFGIAYIGATLFLDFIAFVCLGFVWNKIIDWKNKKLEEKIVYPIIDRRLHIIANKYPQAYSVVKRKLIREPDEKSQFSPDDETIIIELANGDICEYPFQYITMDNKDTIMVRELTLINYVCYDDRKIAKITSILPKLTLNAKLSLMSATILVLGAFILLPSLYYISNPNGFRIFCYVLAGILVIGSISTILGNKISKHSNKKILLYIIEIPAYILLMGIRLIMPVLAILVEVMFILVFALLPTVVVLWCLRVFCAIPISASTICFVTLVIGSFLIVYCPRYIKSIIEWIPLVNHTEGNSSKQKLAEFMRYVYDANTVNFLLNCLYVVLVGVICIRKLQDMGPLINDGIDEAITNAFVVFLAFEGVKTTYNKVNMNSKTFFKKLFNFILG